MTVDQRCKNVPTCQQCWCKKILVRVKSWQNFTLFCREFEYLHNFALFGGIFWHILELYVTLCVFWAFYAVLLRIKFVIIYAVFRVKYFWLKPCVCKKRCLFACLPCPRRGQHLRFFLSATNPFPICRTS